MRESVYIRLQPLQKLGHMVAVGGGVVAGEGEGQEASAVPEHELSRLHRGEEVVLQAVAVDGEVLKGHPGDAGDGVGVDGRRGLRLCQEAVISAVPGLVFREGALTLPTAKPGDSWFVDNNLRDMEASEELHHLPMRYVRVRPTLR